MTPSSINGGPPSGDDGGKKRFEPVGFTKKGAGNTPSSGSRESNAGQFRRAQAAANEQNRSANSVADIVTGSTAKPISSKLSQSRQRAGGSAPGDSPEGYRPLRADGAHDKKRDFSRVRKVLTATIAVLMVFLAGTAVAMAWYYNEISEALSLSENSNELAVVLAEPDYQKPFYVLMIGSDKWEDNEAQSDAMMLVRVDLNEAKITLVSVPRDTPYVINGEKVKLNRVFYAEGPAACVEAVSELTGVPISHYVQLEFDQLESVVDSLGGILVDVPYTIDYTVYTNDMPTVHLDAGEQVLNGEQAVALARMRTAYEGMGTSQDAIRQANIRAMMIATMKKVLEAPINEIPDNVLTVAGMVSTEIPPSELVSWATTIAFAPKVVVYSCTGPALGDIDSATKLWLTKEAPEAWEALMAVVDEGKNPKDVLTVNEIGDLKLQTTEVIGQSS